MGDTQQFTLGEWTVWETESGEFVPRYKGMLLTPNGKDMLAWDTLREARKAVSDPEWRAEYAVQIDGVRVDVEGWPFYDLSQARVRKVFMCGECGLQVLNTVLHAEWHDGMDERIG